MLRRLEDRIRILCAKAVASADSPELRKPPFQELRATYSLSNTPSRCGNHRQSSICSIETEEWITFVTVRNWF